MDATAGLTDGLVARTALGGGADADSDARCAGEVS
jgi:hypothetical protein